MSEEREFTKPGEPDFMLHQHKPGEAEQHKPGEAEPEDIEGSEDDDFELHQHKPVGDIVEKYKEI